MSLKLVPICLFISEFLTFPWTFSSKVIQLLFKLKCANFWQGQAFFTGTVVLLHTWYTDASTFSQTLRTIQEWIFFHLIPAETNESFENMRKCTAHHWLVNKEYVKDMKLWMIHVRWPTAPNRNLREPAYSLFIFNNLPKYFEVVVSVHHYRTKTCWGRVFFFFFHFYCYYSFYRICSRRSESLFKPAGVNCLSLFKDTSTELRGAAALLEFLQTLRRILSKQETLQRVEESALHELLFLLRAGFFLETEDLRHLLLQVAEQLCPGVCSLQPFLQHQTQEHDWFHNGLHLSPPRDS